MVNQSHNNQVKRYYSSRESRWGYRTVLGGTRHFGFYDSDPFLPNMRAGLRRMEDKLGETLNMPAGARVLDAGCGEGRVATHLYRHYGLKVDGVDLLDFSIERARVLATEIDADLVFNVADYTDLPYPDGFFDAVYTMETLVHAENHMAALSEFHRVLKPGGKIVCFEYSMAEPGDLSSNERYLFEVINSRSAMSSFQAFTHGSFGQIFRSAGFDDVDVKDASRNIQPMLRFFWMLGIVPYSLCRLVGRRERFINILSGVELYNLRRKWRYNIVTAAKRA